MTTREPSSRIVTKHPTIIPPLRFPHYIKVRALRESVDPSNNEEMDSTKQRSRSSSQTSEASIVEFETDSSEFTPIEKAPTCTETAESKWDTPMSNASTEEQFRLGLSSCKVNILTYVKDHFLVKYNIELNNARSKLNATSSRLNTITSAHYESQQTIAKLEEELTQAKNLIARFKQIDDSSSKEIAELKVKNQEQLREQDEIRSENKRMKEERNTLMLENKKLRREKEALARELDVTLLKMSKMNPKQERNLKTQPRTLKTEHQRFIKKLTSGVSATPPDPKITSPNSKPIEFRTEKEIELALDLEIFVSRLEQMKPIVTLLKESEVEFRQYLKEFLRNIAELLVRDKENPFKTSKPIGDRQAGEIVSKKQVLSSEEEINIRQIIWAMISDPIFDNDVELASNSDGEIKKKQKRDVSQKRDLVKKMMELETYKSSVTEMRKYIEKRISKNDVLWGMLENDLSLLLTQPSIGRFAECDSSTKANTENGLFSSWVHFSHGSGMDNSTRVERELQVDEDQHRGRELQKGTYEEDRDQDFIDYTSMGVDLSLQHSKAQMFASFANNIPSIFDLSKHSPKTARYNITNNTNLFSNSHVTPTSSPNKTTPNTNPSSAISNFQRDKRVELFRRQLASRTSPKKITSPLQNGMSPRVMQSIPFRGAFSNGVIGMTDQSFSDL